MSAQRNAAYLHALTRDLPGALLQPSPQGFQVLLFCSECGKAVEAFHMMGKLPTDIIAKKVRAKGWQLHKSGHVCPLHKDEKMTDLKSTTAIVPPAVVPASDKARVARREAILILADVFDVEKGQFRGKDNDASVANAVNLSTEAVSKLREEFYGPLKEPGELHLFRSQLVAAKASIDSLEQKWAKDHREQFEAMRRDIRTIGDNLAKTASANGWKS